MIDVFSIHKNENDEYDSLIKAFIYKSAKFSKIQDRVIFNKDIVKSQKSGLIEAKRSYTKTYEKYLDNYSIALDVKGKMPDSIEFAQILQMQKVSFFIAGAYGFEEHFLKKCDKVISLSFMTFSHKIAKLILFEQVFRGLCILNNHPYHK